MTFITNIIKYDAAIMIARRWPGAVMGEPMAAVKFTVKQLKEMNYVGIYMP